MYKSKPVIMNSNRVNSIIKVLEDDAYNIKYKTSFVYIFHQNVFGVIMTTLILVLLFSKSESMDH